MEKVRKNGQDAAEPELYVEHGRMHTSKLVHNTARPRPTDKTIIGLCVRCHPCFSEGFADNRLGH